MSDVIEDLLKAYPETEERERQEIAGTRPRELAPARKPHTKKDFDRATRVKALQYRLAGMTYSQVAGQLGCSASQARGLIQYALRTAETDSVEDMRELENQRLDAMQRAIWPDVLKGDLKAHDRALKILQARARLNGLEAPKKLELAMSVRQEVEDVLGSLEALVEGEVIEDGGLAAIEYAEEVSDDDAGDDADGE